MTEPLSNYEGMRALVAQLTAERDALKAAGEKLATTLEEAGQEVGRLRVEVDDARKRLDMSELGVNNLGTQLTELREGMEALAKRYAAMPSGRGLAGVEPQTVANAIRMLVIASS